MLLSAVDIMFINGIAERDGSWSLHIRTSSDLLPYFSVASCTNYSRWMPAYILHILEIPDEIRSAFKAGQFAIRRTPGKFNDIWSDMGRKTIIKDSKGSGGIIGITCQK